MQNPAQIFVLMARKRDDHDIYECDQQQPHRMREAEAVQLINDKEGEDDNGRGVIPKFLKISDQAPGSSAS